MVYRQKLSGYAVLLILILLSGCASVSVDDRPIGKESRRQLTGQKPAPGAGPVTAVLPLALGLTQAAVKQYPDLVKKSVGLGVYQLVLSAVSNANCFLVVEIRPENVESIVHERWLQQSGIMAAGEVAGIGRQLGAAQVIYGRLYDYAETATEKIVGLNVRRKVSIMVGVQLICTEVAISRQTSIGTAVGYGDGILSATRRAVNQALNNLISRSLSDPAYVPGSIGAEGTGSR